MWQEVRADGGFAYGTINADQHVFQDRGPVYVLTRRQKAVIPSASWLLEQPSRLLDPRYEVVDFEGRDEELGELEAWRDVGGPLLSARWLHGPGGQGKTRLANQFADRCAAGGWQVVTAVHSAGTIVRPPGGQDLSRSGKGLLLMVDYADRWPASHLGWLFSNALIHQPSSLEPLPTRLLLVARSAQSWPALRGALTEFGADTSERLLGSLPDSIEQRKQVFDSARDCFAARYPMAVPERILPPAALDHPGFGLTLTLHMAALVAVDAHSRTLRPPDDPAELSAYLLDRERRNWTARYENRVEGLEFHTPPSVMARTVFTAALTGTRSHQDATAITRILDFPGHPHQLLADHAVCYPPADRNLVLEPLYPDRLAEDFIALTLPGHANDADPWASDAAATLLARDDNGAAPAYTPRAITFLAAAAGRWPHAGAHLASILSADPALAITAGGDALTTLATIRDLDMAVLEAIEPLLPSGQSLNLNAGIAAITERLTRHHLASTTDSAQRAKLQADLARRLYVAGQPERAIACLHEAITAYRQLAAEDPGAFEGTLAGVLQNLAALLGLGMSQWEDALAVGQEAIDGLKRIVRTEHDDLALSMALSNHSIALAGLGRPEEALGFVEESVEHLRRLTAANPEDLDYKVALSNALGTTAFHQNIVTWPKKSVVVLTEEALQLRRALAAANPDAYAGSLPLVVAGHAAALYEAGSAEDALSYAREAVDLERHLAQQYPTTDRKASLVERLQNLGGMLQAMEKWEESLAPTEEAMSLIHQLSEVESGRYSAWNAEARGAVAVILSHLGRMEEALPESRAAVDGFRVQVARANPAREFDLPSEQKTLAEGLNQLTTILSELGHRREAVASAAEAVQLYRVLAAAFPDTKFDHDLVWALDRLATALSQHRRPWRARATKREADRLRRLLAPTPNEFIQGAIAALLGGAFRTGQPPEKQGILAHLRRIDLRTKLDLLMAGLLFTAAVLVERLNGHGLVQTILTGTAVAALFLLFRPRGKR